LAFSWRLVAFMTTSARTAGSIRSTAVAIPRFAMPSVFLAFSFVAGSRIVACARSVTSSVADLACEAASVAVWRACSAACLARSRKLMRA
jgi:hypothetical protein